MIYVLIPVFNEEGNLPSLHATLTTIEFKEPVCYVFVDDGSTDQTVDTLHTLFGSCTHHVLKNPQNQGPGYSFNHGFDFILNQLNAHKDDTVVTLEGDNTSDPGILTTMLTLNKLGYDLVLASPYAQGGGFDQTTLTRKITSFFANLLLRIWFDVKVLTLSSFYRVYSVSLLLKLSDQYKPLIKENGFISKVEILIKSIKVGAQIIEVPMVLHSSKRVGKSKMKVFKTMMSYARFFIRSKI